MKTVKIYISPSNQQANRYATGGTNEAEQCEKIAKALSEALKRCAFETKIGERNFDMSKRCEESNLWGADLHLPIHTNAGGGVGTEVFIKDDNEIPMAEALLDELCKITLSGVRRGVKRRSSLIELNSTPRAAYVEIDFHDDPNIALWIIDSTELIANAMARAICTHFGIEYVPPEEKRQLRVGDTVYFSGNKHYSSSVSNKYYKATPGEATITHIASNALHPYHLIAIKTGTSNVYGWCNTEDVELSESPAEESVSPPVYVRGQKIRLNKAPLYSSSTAKKQAASKTGTFYIYDGKLINGRYRITTKPQYVAKAPASLFTTGYIDPMDIIPT
ncbi:MAG: N-acetylmuramoyl-L-alanine amidase [Clostridiales bacterium]|nr:N-acetylmuramoyl-L-alanine amidase [Clostridiales bacterium]